MEITNIEKLNAMEYGNLIRVAKEIGIKFQNQKKKILIDLIIEKNNQLKTDSVLATIDPIEDKDIFPQTDLSKKANSIFANFIVDLLTKINKDNQKSILFHLHLKELFGDKKSLVELNVDKIGENKLLELNQIIDLYYTESFVEYEPYNGPAGPSIFQILKNHLHLTHQLEKLDINFIIEDIQDKIGVDCMAIAITIKDPVDQGNIFINFDRWGYVVEKEEEGCVVFKGHELDQCPGEGLFLYLQSIATKSNIKETPQPTPKPATKPVESIDIESLEEKFKIVIEADLTVEEKVKRLDQLKFPRWKMGRIFNIKYDNLKTYLV